MPKPQKVHQEARAPSGAWGHLSGFSPWCLLYCFVEEKFTKDASPELEHLFIVKKMVRWCLSFCRCCNTCDDVREAYRRRGWAFKNPDSIEQCKREGFSQKMQEQKNEGCQVYGFLEVNKVRDGVCCEPAAWWWWLWKGRVRAFLSFSSFRCLQDCDIITGLSQVLVPVKGFSRRVRKSGGKGLILCFVVWAGRKHAGWRSLAFPTV